MHIGRRYTTLSRSLFLKTNKIGRLTNLKKMLGITKRRLSRKSESVERVIPDSERTDNDSPAPTLAKLLVEEDPVEIPDTPPLSPTSETADDPSTEEPTVEEVIQVIATSAPANEILVEDAELTTDEAGTEDGTDSEEDFNRRPGNGLNYAIFRVWFIVWASALAIGVLAYYLNTHQLILASRLAKESAKEKNILVMPRAKWDEVKEVLPKASPFTARRVIVLQTDTESCITTETCTKLLNNMKRQQGTLRYNFMLATDGCIYEGLGWQEPSPMYPEERTMVVAFIGNYETVAPTGMQVTQLQSLLQVSEELKYLTEDYKITGKKQTVVPNKLFARLSGLDHWDKHNSDILDDYVDVELEPFPIFAD